MRYQTSPEVNVICDVTISYLKRMTLSLTYINMQD